MQSFQDNSKYVTMIKNRPSISLIPEANKRIMAQRLGSQCLIGFTLVSTLSLIGYKYFLETSSLYVNKTKKAFSFESDPYSGTVKCTYNEVPNKQYGF
jgi:hypothetical protein